MDISKLKSLEEIFTEDFLDNVVTQKLLDLHYTNMNSDAGVFDKEDTDRYLRASQIVLAWWMTQSERDEHPQIFCNVEDDARVVFDEEITFDFTVEELLEFNDCIMFEAERSPRFEYCGPEDRDICLSETAVDDVLTYWAYEPVLWEKGYDEYLDDYTIKLLKKYRLQLEMSEAQDEL